MKEKTKNLMFGLVGGAIVLLLILLLLGVPLGPLSIGDRADLRLIALPYLESTNIKDDCLASGASWHETTDLVGCDGIGPNSCQSDIVLSGQAQCIATGASWFCQTGPQGGIYCRY